MNYTTPTLAMERLASIQSSRYPISPKFTGTSFVSHPTTLDIIEACDSLKHMCLERPQYLPEDMTNAYSNLLACNLNMKQAYDRRMAEEEIEAAKVSKRSNPITNFRRVAMGVSGKKSKMDYTIEELEAELLRREK